MVYYIFIKTRFYVSKFHGRFLLVLPLNNLPLAPSFCYPLSGWLSDKGVYFIQLSTTRHIIVGRKVV